jgi:hypothetical protein
MMMTTAPTSQMMFFMGEIVFRVDHGPDRSQKRFIAYQL